MKKPHRPLLWVCLALTNLTLISYSLAFVLPYWFARYPQSKNRFLRLGLWEVCLENFMPEAVGNWMYTGCFYLYDPLISSVWSFIFRTWFLVSQVFCTLAFIASVAAEVAILTQSFNLLSPRGPKTVLFLFLASALNCLFLLIALITMGVGVDSEVRRQANTEHEWLQGLDECGLSWSFGLAAIALFASFTTVVILGWCVHPKRVPHGLLLIEAWEWPTLDDMLCRRQITDMQVVSNRSRSDQIYSTLARSTKSDHTGRMESVLSSQKSVYSSISVPAPYTIASQRFARSQISDVHDDYKPSTYDPRSPDTVSLLSFDAPVARTPGTLSEQSSISSRSQHVGLPSEKLRSPSIVDSETTTLPGSRQLLSQTKSMQSTETSVWSSTTNSVQAARPMRKTRDSHRRSSKKQLELKTMYPPLTEHVLEESPPETKDPPVPIQAAKRMRRPQ